MLPTKRNVVLGYRESRVYGKFHIEVFVKGHGLVFSEGHTREEALKSIQRRIKHVCN